jgi:NAD-dependent deacetylase
MTNTLDRAADLIAKAENILVFTGAGLSTGSGIPDFRSPGGIWDRYDPSDFQYQKIVSDERAREKYWRMSTEYYEVMKKANPNPAHKAIKTLEDMGKLLAVVTQNIDNLHQRAGNSAEKIIEIHGTAFRVSCLTCGKRYEREEVEKRIRSGVKIPYCDDCGGILKPDTISFGQAMPEHELKEAFRLAESCDLCMVLGSSLVVYPAAAIPEHAVASGASLFIVNRDPTPLDDRAVVVINDLVGKILPQLLERAAG